MSTNSGYSGFLDPSHSTSEYNSTLFLIEQILAGRHHMAIVQVKTVTNNGAVAAVGMVDVQPMVHQLDANGAPVPHGVLHALPYLRLQGGGNAIILDPQAGDIGLAVFADRDISSAKASKAAANPGSMRRNDMADGVYLGGILNGVPTQYVQFSASGIKLHSPAKITLDAPVVEIDAGTSCTINTPQFTVNGASQFNGTVTTSDTVTAPNVVGTNDVSFGGKSGVNHMHSGVQSGTSNTGKPV